MTYTVRVTGAHYAKGKRVSSLEDPVALAITDALGPGHTVAVTYRTIRVIRHDSPNRVFKVPTPDAVRERMEAWDSLRPVEPFEFELELESGS